MPSISMRRSAASVSPSWVGVGGPGEPLAASSRTARRPTAHRRRRNATGPPTARPTSQLTDLQHRRRRRLVLAQVTTSTRGDDEQLESFGRASLSRSAPGRGRSPSPAGPMRARSRRASRGGSAVRTSGGTSATPQSRSATLQRGTRRDRQLLARRRYVTPIGVLPTRARGPSPDRRQSVGRSRPDAARRVARRPAAPTAEAPRERPSRDRRP